jgi:pimeloyl-ACP methyl ester carboxylesterase
MRIENFRVAAMTAGETFWRGANLRAAEARAELARRAVLARMPAPEGITGPPLRRLLGELGVLGRRSMGSLEPYESLNPHGVMMLPGFGAHPLRMRRMKRALEDAGHRPHEWGLGFNLGPTAENFDFLLRRVADLAEQEGQPIALVGWSLGGLFAREIARREPQHVRKVITLGTPFSGDPHANNAWRAYHLITGHAVDAPPIEVDFSTKPPVPTIALWSPKDGVIAPRAAAGWPHERDRAVAVRCNHLAFAADPQSIHEVLRQLDFDD